MIGAMAGNGSLAGALKACHSACLLEFMDFFFFPRGTRDRPILATEIPSGAERAKNSRDYMNSSSLSVEKIGREDNVTLFLYSIPSS